MKTSPTQRSLKKISTVLMFSNGNIAAFDDNGRQIPELQVGLLMLWAEHAERQGYSPDGVTIETQSGLRRIAKTEEGYIVR